MRIAVTVTSTDVLPEVPPRSSAGDTPLLLRGVAARAVGCPAAAPALEALGLVWRLRADALLLAASYTAANVHPALRAEARRLRRRGQVWASGARRLEGCSERRAAWLQSYFEQLAALPNVGAAAYGAMSTELAVWRLARLVQAVPRRAGGAA